MIRIVHLRAALLVFALGAWCAPTLAEAQCSFTFAGTMAFGSYDPAASAPDDATSTLTYSCTSGGYSPYIQLSTGGSGTYSQRQMSGSGDTLGYNLYSDPARQQIWGDSPPPAAYQYVTSKGSGPTHGASLTVYGRITPGQWVAPGSYADTITATINF
jgi:spore coat protein U-like protein